MKYLNLNFNVAFAIGFLMCVSNIFAQTPPDTSQTNDAESLQELMNVQFDDDQLLGVVKQNSIGVASTSIKKEEEVASITSVITRKDIETYGYRELSDILRTVPGFEFGVDGVGSYGQGFRGLWIYEGKGLLMINGIVVNDLSYGNTNLIGTIPTAMIQRVEIIRGPGSVLYGSFALITVVNVITTNDRVKEYFNFTTSGSMMARNNPGTSVGLAYGGQIKNVRVGVSMGYYLTPFSARVYQDYRGNQLQQGIENTPRQYNYMIATLAYKNIELQYNRTQFRFNGQDAFDTIRPRNQWNRTTERLQYYTDGVNFKYTKKLGNLRIEPSAQYVRGTPMFAANAPYSTIMGEFLNTTAICHRIRGQVGAYYEKEKFEVSAGGGYIRDIALNASNTGAPGLYGNNYTNDSTDLVFSRYTKSWFGFAELAYKLHPTLTATAGVRYETTTFGDASAPRFALVYFKDKVNVKAMFTKSYRIPTPNQAFVRWIQYNPNLIPEGALNYDLEVGYEFTDNIVSKINGFMVEFRDPIVWNGPAQTYYNYSNIKSIGFESNTSFTFNKWGGFFNFEYAKPLAGSTDIFLNQQNTMPLGLPPLKVNLGLYYRKSNFEIAPSFIYFSQRYGQTAAFAALQQRIPLTTAFESKTYPALLMGNVNIRWRKILKNTDLSFSVFNFTNANYLIIQPYYAGHMPTPANDRQFTLSLQYHFTE